jgi:hypothetical protein
MGSALLPYTFSNLRGRTEGDIRAVARFGAAAEIHTCICSTADERPPQFGVFWLISIIVNQPTSHPWNAPAIQIAVANIVSYKSESQYLILVLS